MEPPDTGHERGGGCGAACSAHLQTPHDPVPSAPGSLGKLITLPALHAIRRCLSKSRIGRATRPATLSLNTPTTAQLPAIVGRARRWFGSCRVRSCSSRRRAPGQHRNPGSRSAKQWPSRGGPWPNSVSEPGNSRLGHPSKVLGDQASWALATSTRAANPASSWTAMSARTLRSISTSASFRPWMNWP